MRYSTYRDPINPSSMFTVSIENMEISNLTHNSQIRNFEQMTLSRLANIIAGWMFKHHRNELIEPILNNVVDKVSKEVSAEILHRLGLPLEGNWEKKE